MIGLLVVDAVLIFCIIILAIKLWDCSANLARAEYRIDLRGAEIRELKQRCDAHKELIKALSKSVRELNGVVEEAVKVKEETSDNKPDMSALIGGWLVDDVRTKIDASHISTGTIMMWHGRFVNECGRLADGTVVWGDKDGRLYVGDAKLYEMDQ